MYPEEKPPRPPLPSLFSLPPASSALVLNYRSNRFGGICCSLCGGQKEGNGGWRDENDGGGALSVIRSRPEGHQGVRGGAGEGVGAGGGLCPGVGTEHGREHGGSGPARAQLALHTTGSSGAGLQRYQKLRRRAGGAPGKAAVAGVAGRRGEGSGFWCWHPIFSRLQTQGPRVTPLRPYSLDPGEVQRKLSWNKFILVQE